MEATEPARAANARATPTIARRLATSSEFGPTALALVETFSEPETPSPRLRAAAPEVAASLGRLPLTWLAARLSRSIGSRQLRRRAAARERRRRAQRVREGSHRVQEREFEHVAAAETDVSDEFVIEESRRRCLAASRLASEPPTPLAQ
jgi:hypothetical protein